jgi:hypothetical protein
MKKLLSISTFVLCTCLFLQTGYAQMSYTCPNPTTSTFTSIVGTPGAVNALAFGAQNNDDPQTAAIDLEAISPGFRFYLSGNVIAYRYMGISANGWCWFSATGGWAAHNYSSLSSPTFSTWVNSFTNVRDAAAFTYKPLLSCFWDDLTLTSSGNSRVAYKITGVSPNRILTIEWNKVQRYPDFSGNGAASFQAIVRENPFGGTNPSLISYNYFNEGTFSSTPTASIGVLGTCPGDYYSLNNSGPSPIASQTVETTNITAFAANNQLYRFTGAVSASAFNDDICNAAALPYNTNSTCNTTVGTTKGATVQAFAVTGGAAGGACLTAPSNRDVWYTVTKPIGFTVMQISTDNVLSGGVCSSGGVQFQVYTMGGACGAPTLTEIAGGCSNNGGVLNPLNSTLALSALPAPATTYYIRVSGDADAQLDFQICVQNSSNNEICGAVELGTVATPNAVANLASVGTTIRVASTADLAVGMYVTVSSGTGVFAPNTYITAIVSATQFTVSAIPTTVLQPGATIPTGFLPATACNTVSSTTVGATPSRCSGAPGILGASPNAQTISGGADCGNSFLLSNVTGATTTFTVVSTAGLINGPISVYSGTGVFPASTTLTVISATQFTTSAAPTVALNNATILNVSTACHVRDVWFKFKTPATAKDYVIETFSASLNDVEMAIYAGTPNCGAVPTTGPLSTNTFFSTYNFDPQIRDKVASIDLMSRIVSNNLLPNRVYYVRVWKKTTVVNEGTFTICAYERPSCGVTATCTAVSPYTYTSFAYNPNGNYNATKCTTPIALPNDTNGVCYLKAPKIPTIGTNFSPLCGDNFRGPSYTVAATAAASSGATTFTVSLANAALLKVGAYLYTTASFSFTGNCRITAIDLGTGVITISLPLSAGLASGAVVTVIDDMPANSLSNTFGANVGAGNAASVPNMLNPMFYRIKNDVVGNLTINFSNILGAYNRGIRAGLFTLDMDAGTAGIQAPTSPNYDCYNGTWLPVTTTTISNSSPSSPFSGLKLYGNTPTGTGNYNPAAVTGTQNTDKFSMTYNSLPIGVYYLLVDGANGDRAYFDLSLTGTIATGNGVLPIRLLSFTGKNSGGINTLKWSTASEENNDYFTLERSFNGEIFEPIAQIDGAGNSAQINNYSHVDPKTSVGVTYYRLKQTDFNQKSTYSDIIALYSKTGKVLEFTGLRPNPAAQIFYMDVVAYENTTLTLEIRDVSGKLVRQHNASVNQGESSIESTLDGLENGLYFVRVYDEKSGESFTKKVVKQN